MQLHMLQKATRLLLLVVAAFPFLMLPAALAQGAATQVDRAKDPGTLSPLPLYAEGRVEMQHDPADKEFGATRYVYQWPGTYFTASFRGSEVYFRVGEGQQILHVLVDAKPPQILVKPQAGTYRLAGLGAGAHTIRVEVATESQPAPDSFDGFAIPPSVEPLPAPRETRQIEFIGDSHTVGYGNTSSKRVCTADEIWADTDTSAAFGPITAKHFHADYQINAISGRGIVRNYNGGAGDTIPAVYPYVLFDKKNLYGDSAWHPQVIVIALGTNDFSTPLHAGEPWKTEAELDADYEKDYVKFVESLRSRDPGAFFILWATNGANGKIEAEVEKVVEKLKSMGEKRVVFLPVNGLGMTACDWHPSTTDDKTIADKLIAVLDEHPGVWQSSQ